MIEPDAFKAEVEAYLSRTKIAATRFGREAVGDPSFVFDLRKGRMPGWRVAERVRQFMSRPRFEQGLAAASHTEGMVA